MAIDGIGPGAGGFANVAANALQDNLQSKAARSVSAVLEGGAGTTETEIEDAARQMESLFASMLVKEMRGSMSKGFFGDGPGSDVYNEWFDKNIGEAIAKDGGLGMVGMLKVQLGIESAVEARKAQEMLSGEEANSAKPDANGPGEQL
jgi:Rod binding domain-containing protein